MRILILSQYYDPEPVPKPSDLACALTKRGHTVSVITGIPNYPLGRVYAGYRLRLFQREDVDGVPVIRCIVFPYHGHSALGRIVSYFSFLLSAMVAGCFSPPCDLIYVWHPPLTIGIAAWLIGFVKRAPFVYDVQDIWPESLIAAGKISNPLVVRAIHQMERFVYKRAEHLLVVTSGAKNNLVNKGVPPDKITAAGLWVDIARFTLDSRGKDLDIRARYRLGDRLVIMYTGNMGYLQGLETVVCCAEILRENKDIIFVLVGDGIDRERLVLLVKELALQNVLFIESQPISDIPTFLSCADILLVHLKEPGMLDLVIPGKTLAYLASGRPIIMAMNGEGARLLTQAKAGLVVPPGDPKEMSKAVLHLSGLTQRERDSLGENGRAYLQCHFSKEKVMQQYEKIFFQAHANRGK